jgi:hypothetical protein
MAKPIKLDEIASRINAHLKRFEADPDINRKWTEGRREGLSPYYLAGAGRSGNRVFVSYVNYQGVTGLTKPEAIRYLAWMDASNVGKHVEIPKNFVAESANQVSTR